MIEQQPNGGENMQQIDYKGQQERKNEYIFQYFISEIEKHFPLISPPSTGNWSLIPWRNIKRQRENTFK